MKRKLTAFCISAALLCGVMPAFPAAAEDWNDLEYVRWKLENGVLTLSGTGSTPDYHISSGTFGKEPSIVWAKDVAPPWYERRSEITEIVIDDAVTGIGMYAFAAMPNLEKVTMGQKLSVILDYAFVSCPKLEEIQFCEDGALTFIGSNAFAYQDTITEITLPESLRTLAGDAFDSSDLEKMHLPAGLEEIAGRFLPLCDLLTEITIPEENTCYTIADGALYTEDLHELVRYPSVSSSVCILPDGVRSIRDMAFSNCGNLESVYLPDGITSLSNNTFYRCAALSYIRLPETLETLNGYAFQRCDRLCYPLIPASVTSIEEKAFNSSGAEAICFVGTQEQWNAIAKPADDSTLAKRPVRFGVQPIDILSADLNADGCVDAVDSAVMLQYAAAAGSGETDDYALYRMQQGFPAAVCSNDTADRSCSMDLSADEALNALDAAVVLQYAAAAGSGYTKGLSGYLSEIGSQT